MCRVVSHRLEPALHAVAQARETVRTSLQRWELEPLAPDAVLLTSELVTNALVHAHGQPVLSVAVADGVLEVGVTDRRPGPMPGAASASGDAAANCEPDPPAEGGRGLRLLDLIAQEWGVSPLPEGKQVWFRLQVDDSWPHRTSCPCAGEALERVRLESGRYAVAAAGPWDT